MRHFSQKDLSAFLLTLKEQNKAFLLSSPRSPMQCWAAVRAALWHEFYHKVPVENNKYSNFEWKKEGRGVNCFVLSRENSSLKLPTGTLLNNFVTDCGSNTSVLRYSWLFRVKNDFCESFDLSRYEQKTTRRLLWAEQCKRQMSPHQWSTAELQLSESQKWPYVL